MPRVAYSLEEKQRLRQQLVAAALELMARQGIQHTTVEQIYQKVGISRSFFYSFFPTKEDLVVEALYLQQPRILAYAKKLMEDPSLSWSEGVDTFLRSCCYGEQNGIAVLTIEGQQHIFRRLSPENCQLFRQKQSQLFGKLLECFGVPAGPRQVALFTNLCLTLMVIRRAIPETLPFLVPEAADETADFQIQTIIHFLDGLRR